MLASIFALIGKLASQFTAQNFPRTDADDVMLAHKWWQVSVITTLGRHPFLEEFDLPVAATGLTLTELPACTAGRSDRASADTCCSQHQLVAVT